MGAIILPKRLSDGIRPFLELANKPEEHKRVADTFTRILAKSYAEDERRSGRSFRERICTDTETKRRADIVGKWFRELRAGLGFSLNRTLDELPRALRCELDGGTYSPPEQNRLWAPGGAN